jgi:hypothetical protein
MAGDEDRNESVADGRPAILQSEWPIFAGQLYAAVSPKPRTVI